MREGGGRRIVVSEPYKFTVLIVFVFTLALFVVDAILSVAIDDPNEATKKLLATCDTLVTAGAGAIFGLVTGKAVDA